MLPRGATFEESTHAYKQDGVSVPSCTRVLDHSGIASYDMVRQEILERKARIGTLAHTATQFYDEGDLDWDSIKDDIKGYVDAWVGFRSDTGFTPRRIEDQFIATLNGMTFGLKVDREGIFCKSEAIVEIKTSVQYMPWWGIQLAGYALGLPDHEGKVLTPRALFARRRRIAVQLFSNGKYKKHDFNEPGDAEVFASGLHIAHWKISVGQKLRDMELAA